LGLTAGCNWKSADGRNHALVFGFGIVSSFTTLPTTQSKDLLVEGKAMEATGIFVGNAGPFAGAVVGHVEIQQLSVAPQADVLVEYTRDEQGRHMRVEKARRPATTRCSIDR